MRRFNCVKGIFVPGFTEKGKIFSIRHDSKEPKLKMGMRGSTFHFCERVHFLQYAGFFMNVILFRF